MDSTNKYKVIGLMSGTSLDGLDIALCTFSKKQTWSFSLDACETIRYSATWQKVLAGAHRISAAELLVLHTAYGNFLGEEVRRFQAKHKIKSVDFVASHGHTIFHQPHRGFTFQLGNGNALHQVSGLPVVYDFRSLDVAAGGQGAPLVPIGDQLLFGNYDVCLNLGGIANLSLEDRKKRIAYDICFANMSLNYLAKKIGKQFDMNGLTAEQGEINSRLLTALNKKYKSFHSTRPSLGRELFERDIMPLLDDERISVKDRLRTTTESIAQEIAVAVGKKRQQSVLVTGGGAFNSFLMYRLVEQCGDENQLVVPDESEIKYKEAIVFAFLGVLRVRGEINALASVTKAGRDTSGGVMVGF